MPNSGIIPWHTAVSLMSTVRVLDREKIPVRIEAPVGSSVVTWARDAIVAGFLKTDFTHLFWIDSDIAWAPNDFVRLLGFGAMLDVVGATYPFKKDPFQVLVNPPRPNEVNGLGCLRIKSMGLGFTLCKREVIEKLAAAVPTLKDPLNGIEMPDLFRLDRGEDGGPRGEDVNFFNDVHAAGYEAWLDPSINLGHIGQKTFKGDVIDALGLAKYAKEAK
jgi:hypothetical protein